MEHGSTLFDGLNPVALSHNITSKVSLIVRSDGKTTQYQKS
jgi:hypothetical protein